jgi:DNA-binding MarR family transcriptional regulator
MHAKRVDALYFTDTEPGLRSFLEHERIIRALGAHDGSLAMDLMRAALEHPSGGRARAHLADFASVRARVTRAPRLNLKRRLPSPDRVSPAGHRPDRFVARPITGESSSLRSPVVKVLRPRRDRQWSAVARRSDHLSDAVSMTARGCTCGRHNITGMAKPELAGAGPVTGDRRSALLSLDQTIGHLLRRGQQVHTALWLAEFAGEVTAPQFALLLAIYRDGPLAQVSAGQLVSLDRSTTADVVARLERHGWILRSRDPLDGRRNVLGLTRAARAGVSHLTGKVIDVQQRLIEPVELKRRRWFIDKLAVLAYAGQAPEGEAAPTDNEELVAVPLSLHRAPGHLIRRSEQLHGSHWLAMVGTRLTPSQYGLMTGIASAGLVDQRRVGELASLDKTSISNIAERLLRRGLIAKETDCVDRRRKLLCLTDTGWDLMRDVAPAVRAVQASLLGPLSKLDATELTKLLREVAYRGAATETYVAYNLYRE